MTNAEWCQQHGIKFSELSCTHDSDDDLTKWGIINENPDGSYSELGTLYHDYSCVSPVLLRLDQERDILTAKEKDYLQKLINIFPHKDKLRDIVKESASDPDTYYLQFEYGDWDNDEDGSLETIEFLPFKSDEMYIGMKPMTLYTPEELGLETKKVKVYVICSGEYSDKGVDFVTLDKDRAEELRKIAERNSWDNYAWIQEYDTDKCDEVAERGDRQMYKVTFLHNSYTTVTVNYWLHKEDIYEDGLNTLVVIVSAKNTDEALKIAADRRAKYIAEKEGLT